MTPCWWLAWFPVVFIVIISGWFLSTRSVGVVVSCWRFRIRILTVTEIFSCCSLDWMISICVIIWSWFAAYAAIKTEIFIRWFLGQIVFTKSEINWAHFLPLSFTETVINSCWWFHFYTLKRSWSSVDRGVQFKVSTNENAVLVVTNQSQTWTRLDIL